MARFRNNRHQSQYQAGTSDRTHRQGCTWTSAANGVDAATGGKVLKTPDQILALVPRSQETDPATPGWSLYDVDKAMAKIGVGFEVRTGRGWADVVAQRNRAHYILAQGDSDRFPNTTCSGAFDGLHCIGIHPNSDANGAWRIDDPICGSARYETAATIRSYMTKLSSSMFFGIMTTPVPLLVVEHQEDHMKFDNRGPVIGIVTMIDTWTLWDIETDARTTKVPKGTQFQCFGVTHYYPNGGAPEGYVGYLVDHNGKAAIVPSKDVSHLRMVGDKPL